MSAFVVAVALLAARADAGADPLTEAAPASVAGRALLGAAGWLCVVAILGFATRVPRGLTRYAPLWRYLDEATLPLYVVHQPVLVAVAFGVVGTSLHPAAAYVAIVLGTLVASLAVHHLLLRRVGVLRVLVGLPPAGHAVLSRRSAVRLPDRTARGVRAGRGPHGRAVGAGL